MDRTAEWVKCLGIGLLILLPFMGACSGGRQESKGVMEIPELGFSMKMPPGWRQGRPLIRRGKKYERKVGGRHCFLSETAGYPFGRVLDFSLDGYGSLEEYVDTPPTLHAQVVSKTARTVAGLEAIEILGEGFGEKRIPVRGLHVYIRRGDRAVLVTFLCQRERFAQYEGQWREAIDTIGLSERRSGE